MVVTLNAFRLDFEQWLPAALVIVSEGLASIDKVTKAAKYAFEDGANAFRDTFLRLEIQPEDEAYEASTNDLVFASLEDKAESEDEPMLLTASVVAYGACKAP